MGVRKNSQVLCDSHIHVLKSAMMHTHTYTRAHKRRTHTDLPPSPPAVPSTCARKRSMSTALTPLVSRPRVCNSVRRSTTFILSSFAKSIFSLQSWMAAEQRVTHKNTHTLTRTTKAKWKRRRRVSRIYANFPRLLNKQPKLKLFRKYREVDKFSQLHSHLLRINNG